MSNWLKETGQVTLALLGVVAIMILIDILMAYSAGRL